MPSRNAVRRYAVRLDCTIARHFSLHRVTSQNSHIGWRCVQYQDKERRHTQRASQQACAHRSANWRVGTNYESHLILAAPWRFRTRPRLAASVTRQPMLSQGRCRPAILRPSTYLAAGRVTSALPRGRWLCGGMNRSDQRGRPLSLEAQAPRYGSSHPRPRSGRRVTSLRLYIGSISPEQHSRSRSVFTTSRKRCSRVS